MFFYKRKYIVEIKGGEGKINSENLRGMVKHLIVRPKSLETVYDFKMLDKEGDEMIEVFNHKGRLDDREGIPLGKDQLEKMTFVFENVTHNDPIKIILKIEELR